MAKTPVEVNRQALVTAIRDAESAGPLANRSILWAKVAEVYNKTNNPIKPLSPSVVYLRVNEWNLQVTTPKGKKGRGAGWKPPVGPRTSRKDKIAANPEYQKVLAEKRQDMTKFTDSARFLPLLDAVEKGSRTAAVKLNCVECSNWSTSEVRKCTATGCALWIFRPYQGKVTSDEDTGEEENEDITDNEEDA